MSLLLDAPSYVRRQADEELYQALRVLNLDLLTYDCDLRFAAALRYRVPDYLRTNAELKKGDAIGGEENAGRHLCD